MTKTQSDKRLGYRKYTYNISILFNNSAQSLYWLGFIAADGCIGKQVCKYVDSHYLVIALKESDLQHLLSFCNYINYTNPPLYNKKTKSYGIHITISENDFIRFKSEYNITERKSLTLDPPPLRSLEESLFFIIGYIDGDGSWNISKRDNNLRLGIRGTKQVLTWIKSIFDTIDTPNRITQISVSDGYPYYQLSGKRALSIFYFLNKMNVIKLDRKWGGLPNEEQYIIPYNGRE